MTYISCNELSNHPHELRQTSEQKHANRRNETPPNIGTKTRQSSENNDIIHNYHSKI